MLQFKLRTLFLITACFSLAFAVMMQAGTYWAGRFVLCCAGLLSVVGIARGSRVAALSGAIIVCCVILWFETSVGVLVADGFPNVILRIHVVDNAGQPIPTAVVAVCPSLEMHGEGPPERTSTTNSDGVAQIECECLSASKESLLWWESGVYIPDGPYIEVRIAGYQVRSATLQEILGKKMPFEPFPIKRDVTFVMQSSN